MLAVLYSAGDWVLLSIAIIFIMGILWAAKKGFIQFLEQLKLLLNLGAVREGERTVYNGIPWRVVSINIYSFLENPELMGGRIRLPIGALKEMKSRPFNSDEPWFPCKVDDWLILEDGTHGKVIVQGVEMIQIVLLGGSRKTYQTSDFLSKNPENLSTNFRIRQVFGIDYKHQQSITAEIPQHLMKTIRSGLNVEGYESDILYLNIEFREAGASSLDLVIILDLFGKCAPNYYRIRRLLQRLCVDACNQHNWVIPFTQITLHNAN